jgi:hypothetical protein
MWNSGMYGFRDEAALYDNTFQQYGQIFIMSHRDVIPARNQLSRDQTGNAAQGAVSRACRRRVQPSRAYDNTVK